MNGVNSLDPVVEATVNERSKVLFEHFVHVPNENGVLRLKELVGWVRPLFNRLFDELSGHNEWVIVWKLSRLGPTLELSHRAAKEGRLHSPLCHSHNLIHIDGTVIRTQIRLFRCEENWRLIV